MLVEFRSSRPKSSDRHTPLKTLLPRSYTLQVLNNCIGDAHQSLSCIKNKNNKIWRKTIFSMPDGILTPCNVARSRHWFRQVTAPCNVTSGSFGMTCHWIRPNVRHIGILHLVSISTYHRSRHVILYQSAKFYPNRTTIGRKKWRHVDFQDGGSQPSWIVRIQ